MAAKKKKAPKSKPAKKASSSSKKPAKKAAKKASKKPAPAKAKKKAVAAKPAKKAAPAKKPAKAAPAKAPPAKTPVKAAAPSTPPKAAAPSTPPRPAAPKAASTPPKPAKRAGLVVWHDLMTTDVDKARSFYAALLPWKTHPVELAPLGVTQRIEAGGAEVGGLVSLPSSEGIPSHWMPYVQVGDLDAVVRRAKELGGFAPVPPTPLDNIGRFAVIADPRGAHISPIELSAGAMGARNGAMPQAGQVAWNEVWSDDPEGSARFFADVFGWGMQKQDMGAMGTYTTFTEGEEQRGGCVKAPDGVPPGWVSYFAVANVDKSFERARHLGAQARTSPMDIPNVGRFAVLEDPTGAAFALFTAKMPA